MVREQEKKLMHAFYKFKLCLAVWRPRNERAFREGRI